MIQVIYRINNSNYSHDYQSLDEAIRDIDLNMINMMPNSNKITNLSTNNRLSLLYVDNRTTAIESNSPELSLHYVFLK
jgi:hypothetical protein